MSPLRARGRGRAGRAVHVQGVQASFSRRRKGLSTGGVHWPFRVKRRHSGEGFVWQIGPVRVAVVGDVLEISCGNYTDAVVLGGDSPLGRFAVSSVNVGYNAMCRRPVGLRRTSWREGPDSR